MRKSVHHIKRIHNLSFAKKINKRDICCMTDFENVIDFGNMYRAFKKSKRGRGYKRSTARFDAMALDGILTLIDELKAKTYTISEYNEFKVYDPKERVIKTTSFKDKVVQHSLCENSIIPRLEEVFIDDNVAGRKNRGTLFGLNRLSQQMKEFHNKHGFNGYILKCDIKKYFYSIPHQQLKDIVEYYFSYDEDICWLCDLFIDSTDNVGLALGNRINQVFGLLFLDGVDKLVKGELGIEYYGRNMDDFWLIHQSKEYLEYCLYVLTEFLKTLGLEFNGKTQIFPMKNGVSYLGFHTYVTKSGMIIRKLLNQKKRNAKRKYTKMAKLVAGGKLSKKKFDDSYKSHKNHLSHGNCYKLAKMMEDSINTILSKGG